MKRALSVLLAIAMVLSLGVTAMAETAEIPTGEFALVGEVTVEQTFTNGFISIEGPADTPAKWMLLPVPATHNIPAGRVSSLSVAGAPGIAFEVRVTDVPAFTLESSYDPAAAVGVTHDGVRDVTFGIFARGITGDSLGIDTELTIAGTMPTAGATGWTSITTVVGETSTTEMDYDWVAGGGGGDGGGGGEGDWTGLTLHSAPTALVSSIGGDGGEVAIAAVVLRQSGTLADLGDREDMEIHGQVVTSPATLPVSSHVTVSQRDLPGGTALDTTREFTVTVFARYDGYIGRGAVAAQATTPVIGSITRIDWNGQQAEDTMTAAQRAQNVSIDVNFNVPIIPDEVGNDPDAPIPTLNTATSTIGLFPGVLVGPALGGLTNNEWRLTPASLDVLNAQFPGPVPADGNNWRVVNGTTRINDRNVPGHITGNIRIPGLAPSGRQSVVFSLHVPDYVLAAPAFENVNSGATNSWGNTVLFQVERLGPGAGERVWLEFTGVTFTRTVAGLNYQIPNNWTVDGVFDELALEQLINAHHTMTGDDERNYALRPMDFTWRIPENFWSVGAAGHRSGITWSQIEHMIGVPGDEHLALRSVHFDRVQLRTSRTTGVNGTIRDVGFAFPASGGANVRVRTLEFMTRTGGTDVGMDLSLAVTGASAARMGRIFLRVGNARLYVQSDSERIDPNHREYMRADGTVRNVEIYAGAGVYFTRNITSGQDLYVAADLATHDGFDTLFQQNAALVDIIEVHASTGWTTAQVQTRIDRDETLFVYDAERRLIGTTADNNLRFSTLYFLTTQQIDLGAGAGNQTPDTTTQLPDDFQPTPPGGGDGGANVNNNFNPGTGL